MASLSTKFRTRAVLLVRLIWVDALQGIDRRRWWLVPPAFGLATFLFKPAVTFDHHQQVYIAAAPWELALAFQALQHFLLWVFAMGFVAIMGAFSLREAGQGLEQLLMLRAPSRELWWCTKLGSMGLQALLYVALGLGAIVITGALLPAGTGVQGPAAEALVGASRIYPQEAHLSAQFLLPLSGLSLAWGLWLYGAALATIALLSGRPFVPLTVAILWLMLSVKSLGPELSGTGRLLGLVYLLSYQKHLGDNAMPVGGFFLLTGGAFLGLVLLGAWGARRAEF